MPISTCPECEAPMEVMTRGEVMIDVCRACRGVWLDGGELEKILAATRAHEEERLKNERAALGLDGVRGRGVDGGAGAGGGAGGGDEVDVTGMERRRRREVRRTGDRRTGGGWFDLGDLLEDLFD